MMLQLGSWLAQFHANPGRVTSEAAGKKAEESGPAVQDFLKHARNISGLKKVDMFCNLRIPNQYQTSRDEINLVILTGHGVFCVDVKSWAGLVLENKQNWHLQVKDDDQTISNTSIQQVANPLQAIMIKTTNLWNHMKRCGVKVSQSLFVPRVIFLSPHCHLDDTLKNRKELVAHDDLDAFLSSFREGYVSWLSDALTPSWISGHLSYGQLGQLREVLKRMGTWDVVELRGGVQLKGDFQSCTHIALNRQETEQLEFSAIGTLSAESLWALLGHTPQITVKMYKRGGQGWLGKALSGSATIPSNTHVVFRISEITPQRLPRSQPQGFMLL
ncbi:uncharacterized protein LOC114784459 isoform X2 [Denticeps clupeoides]|uniref:uncharacterized protein LOC114784459 isoform X2 n=1 Tax=Denticeps clupeoides TaxID=299321 RepID=UPI0010A3B364|nr:uncharacterized protein LOC114784459 isoform X2 [Denticeps clupeoides]